MAAQERSGELLELVLVVHPDHSAQRQDHMALLAGRLGFCGVVAPAGASRERLAALGALAAPARVVPAEEAVPGLVRGRDPQAVCAARQAAAASEPAAPVVVELPVAIGRTVNEAEARADRDPRFRGTAHPRVCGLFGTFEQAQEQVLQLAGAGAGQLRVVLADELDVADLMAQVRALVVGATPALFARSRH